MLSASSVVLLLLLTAVSAACHASSAGDASSVSVVRNADGGIDTALSGSVGDLGAAKPTVSSLMISNSGETLIYMSSAEITCKQLQESRWLGGTPAGSQIVEIVFSGAPEVGTIDVPPGEVNVAPGGKSSSYETTADSGQIDVTAFEVDSLIEGTLTAAYGRNTLSGQFHATFCANGQGY